MSKFWFDMTKDIVPNHMISVDVKDMPEFFQQPKFDGNSMMCKKVQRCFRSSALSADILQEAAGQSYKENGTVCGITLAGGLKGVRQTAGADLYTKSPKAEIGDA